MTAFDPQNWTQCVAPRLMSDTDSDDPPVFAENDTESIGHNSDDAGGVLDYSTEFETEHVIPVPLRNNRRVLSSPQTLGRILYRPMCPSGVHTS